MANTTENKRKITDPKQKAAYITAIAAFIIGWGLTIWGFILPPRGDVSDGTLYLLGEAMVYAASVFGVTLYFQNQMAKLRHDSRQYIDRQIQRDLEQAENEEY